VRRKKVRNQTSYELLAWLDTRLSTQDLVIAHEMLAAAEADAERPFRRLLWLYHGHDQVELSYGRMFCTVRIKRADIAVDDAQGVVTQMDARAATFAARTASFEDGTAEHLALHIQGVRPDPKILTHIREDAEPVRPVPIAPPKRTTERRPLNRAVIGRIGALTLHAQGKTNTQPARAAFMTKFEKQVDPEGILEPAERAKRAEFARKAHYARLSLASAESRRRKSSRSSP
jgi:hypothetical protein